MRAWQGHALVVGAATAVAAVAVALDPAASAPGDLVFGACLLTGLLTLGRHAVDAAGRTRRARRRERALAVTPVREVTLRALSGERVRLATDIEAVVRSAVARMTASAGQALQEWDSDPRPLLREVQAQGRDATTELRRLLGLLRESSQVGAPALGQVGQVGQVGRWRASRLDVALAVGAVAVAAAEHVGYGDDIVGGQPSTASAVLTATAAGTVLLRSAPWAGAFGCGVVLLVAHAAGAPASSGLWTLLTLGPLAWACAARRGRALLSLAGLGFLGCCVGAWLATNDPRNLTVVVAVLGAGAAGGTVVRAAHRWEHRARRRGDEHVGALHRAADDAVRSERVDVARELHDLISSAVGVVVVHAGAAEALLGRDRDAARAALEVAHRTAASTQGELADLVEVVGSGALGAPTTAAGVVAHRICDLVPLVERMRGAGLRISFTTDVPDVADGGGWALGAPVEGTVYRTVQESLTNAARYAPRAAVSVSVSVGPAGVRVDVSDDGPGRGEGTRHGYGLVGIGERVERLGGRLETGPGPDGRGFRVTALLPAPSARVPA